MTKAIITKTLLQITTDDEDYEVSAEESTEEAGEAESIDVSTPLTPGSQKKKKRKSVGKKIDTSRVAVSDLGSIETKGFT